VASDQQSATLVLNATTIVVQILPSSVGAVCPGARIIATDVRLAPPQYPTDGLTRIDVVVPQPSACTRLMVATGAPLSDLASWQVQPLSAWPSQYPVAAA
jgi:hypothetical protein